MKLVGLTGGIGSGKVNEHIAYTTEVIGMLEYTLNYYNDSLN